MKGYKEILVSFTFGFFSLGTFLKILNMYEIEARPPVITEAIPLEGESEDPQISWLWGLNAIQAREAWRIQKGNKEIVVAVIDTGCDVHHPDLKNNIWSNPGESGWDA